MKLPIYERHAVDIGASIKLLQSTASVNGYPFKLEHDVSTCTQPEGPDKSRPRMLCVR